tara:strand:- start:321 stop:905 length:585 start_codon:yes stop_codon:yes gene_type:complete
MAALSTADSRWIWEGIDFRNLLWVFVALGAMATAILWGNDWALRYVHVASGILLTGADILFGFVVGPVIRSLSFDARRAFSLKMLPKTLFIMNTLGIMAPTSGWFLAVRMGYLDLDYPEFWWVVAALAISGILAIQGLGLLLPANLRAYLELRKETPDPERIKRFMRTYFMTLGSQGIFQVLIIVIMVKFATGV